MSTTQFWCPFLAATLILVSGQFATAQTEKTSEKPAAETQQAEQPQTEQAEEMVVRFYPGILAQTAESLRRALGTLVPADWGEEKGVVVVTLENAGEATWRRANLVVRQTPDVQEQVASLVSEVRHWSKAAFRRQYPIHPHSEEVANATLPEQWEGPDGKVWQLFWVPTNSVERLHLTLAALLPEIKAGVVTNLRMLNGDEGSETIMMIHVPKKTRPAVERFFTEWDQTRRDRSEDSKETKPDPKPAADQEDGIGFAIPTAKGAANVVANVVEANQPAAEANYETRYYNFHGRTAESMQKLLPQVLPDIWQAGGKASVSFVPGMGDPGATIGTLMVRQTPAGHEKVEAYFKTLRTASQELQKQIDDKENYPCYSQPADDSGYAVKYHYLPTPMANHLAELLPKYFASDWQQGTVRTLSGPASGNLLHFSYSILIVRQQPAVHEQIDKVIRNVRYYDGQEAEVAVPVPASLRELEATVGGGSFF